MNKVNRPIPESITIHHGQLRATIAAVELAPGSSLLFIEAVGDGQKWMLLRQGYDQ